MSEFDIWCGDVREMLPMVEDASVQCVVTSPPYFGLRDYGTGTWVGGDPTCDHKVGRFERGGLSGKQASNTGSAGDEAKGECPLCGALREDKQIGLEATPNLYIAALVDVFTGIRRVLKTDGTVWLNLGDSYATQPGKGDNVPQTKWKANSYPDGAPHRSRTLPGIKPKDLLGIPWAVAFALRNDGWYLRSDIIWHKPNPMPESVTDRPTKAHEYVFLLTRTAKYYYDADAIREHATKTGTLKHLAGGSGQRAGSREGLRKEEWIERKRTQEYTKPYTGTATKDYASGGAQDPSAVKARIVEKILAGELQGRNRRSVWTVTPQPYAGAHFATMPELLIEPCILAGSKPGDLVLDPFCGSGTVGAVAMHHERNFLGIEANADYINLAIDRITAGCKRVGKVA